jgi:putative DNA primase/helicase
MTLQVQKDVFIDFMRKAGDLARGSGFLARFLVSNPVSTQGYRPYKEPDASMVQLDRFNARITQILTVPVVFDETGDGLELVTLKMTPAAKQVWISYYNVVEEQLRPDGELSMVKDVASKSADNAARIAALFHVFQHGVDGQISESDMAAACEVAAWHLGESRRLLTELQQSPELHDAAKLDVWLVDWCNDQRTNQVNQTDALKFGPHKLRKKSKLTPVLEELVDADRITLAKEGRSTVIIVNPKLLDGGDAWA